MDIGEYTLAQQIKHCFIVTSAINSKFGVFTPRATFRANNRHNYKY